MKLCDRPRDMPRPKVHISYDMIYQIKDQFQISRPITSQLPGRLFSPSDKCKKLSHHFLLHFLINMGSCDHHTKYQGVFP